MARKRQLCSWSDLPCDIIDLIANSLCYVDQKRFRKVCKSWRAANIVKYADKLPWKMGWTSDSCHLYDPSHKQTYTVFSVGTNTRSQKLEEILNGSARVVCSEQDWVLFRNRKTSLFFYNPFTGEIIELPEIYNCWQARFSTIPVSPDCVVFIFHIIRRGRNCIRMCKPGDKTWTKLWIDGDFYSVMDVKYMDGVFYCCLNPRIIGAFTVASNEWKLLPHPYSERDSFLSYENFHVECDGNNNNNLLMSTMASSNRFWYHHEGQDSDCRWHVYRFDQSKIEWLEVESLDDKTLLWCISSSWRLISVDKGSELAGRVVRGFRDSCYFECPCFCPSMKNASCISNLKHSPRPTVHNDHTWKPHWLMGEIWIQPPQPK